MKSIYLTSAFAAAFMAFGGAAHAAVISADALLAQLATAGYHVNTIELRRNVYEIQAINAAGAPVELKIDATTGAQLGHDDPATHNVAEDETEHGGVDDTQTATTESEHHGQGGGGEDGGTGNRGPSSNSGSGNGGTSGHGGSGGGGDD